MLIEKYATVDGTRRPRAQKHRLMAALPCRCGKNPESAITASAGSSVDQSGNSVLPFNFWSAGPSMN